MPVKAFLRRKSTGNELEMDPEVTTPQGTFRTLDRAEVEAQAALRAEKEKEKQNHKGLFSRFSGGNKSHTPTSSKGRQQSFEDESPGYRGSNGSSAANSNLSRVYDASSQSARFSSTSTLPSAGEDGDNMFAHSTNSPHQLKLRGVQTWSGQNGAQVPAQNAFADDAALTQRPNARFRDRSQTQSSYASTTIAPRVDAPLALSNDFSSEFDNMFESLDSKPTNNNPLPPTPEPSTTAPGRSLLTGRQRFQHEPLQVERSLSVDPAPKSWDSRDSNERLITSPTDSEMSPPPIPPHAFLRTPSPAQPPPATSAKDSRYTSLSAFSETYDPAKSNRSTAKRTTSPNAQEPLSTSASARQPLSIPADTRQPLSSSATPRNPISTSASSSSNTLQTPSSPRSTSNSNMATPRAPAHSLPNNTRMESVPLNSSPAAGTDDEDTPLFDAATIQSVNAARKFAESEPPRRVMRADDFRKEKMLAASRPPPTDCSSSEEDEYDDEDEEQRIQAQRDLRRKQEAQLAASREIMRKTVGNDGARPSSQADLLPNNGFPLSMSLNDEWENEEVPLGILKAHGFPSQGRPPARPAGAMPSYTGIAERPASAGALGGGQARASQVPVFARNLPLDPFRVEIPTDRQSFHMGGGMAPPLDPRSSTGLPSAYGGPTNMSYMDVIQAEERAKAIRRGSPANRHFGYGSASAGQNQMQGRSQTMTSMQQPQWGSQPQFQPQQQYPLPQPYPMMPQMPMGGQPGGPDFQLAFMLAQQMLVQQQQQAALAGQMSQMNLNGPPQPNPYSYQNNGFLAPNSAQNPAQRPQSVASNATFARPGPNRFNSMPNTRQAPQDAAPSFGGFHAQQGGGYAPSIAPSERSNIGLASRYRPVVAAPSPLDAASSVSSLTAHATTGAPAVAGARAGQPAASGDAEEEAAWKGIGERRKKWGRKGKKEGEGLGELWAGERA